MKQEEIYVYKIWNIVSRAADWFQQPEMARNITRIERLNDATYRRVYFTNEKSILHMRDIP